MRNRQPPDKKLLRRFGLTLAFIFAGAFGLVLPWYHHRPSPIWPWIIAGVLAPWALAHPGSLRHVWRFWMLLGSVLGWINSRIILTVVFFLVVTPLGLWRRLMGSSPIALRLDAKAGSYRIASTSHPPEQMKEPY